MFEIGNPKMKFVLSAVILLIFNQLSLFSGGLAITNQQSIEFVRNSGQLKFENLSTKNVNTAAIEYYANTKFGKIFIRNNGFAIQAESFFKQDDNHDEETALATNVHLATSNAKHLINVEFVNANLNTQVHPEFENNGYLNFYNSKSTPVLGVKSFKRVIIKNLYPQIDIVFYENAEGELEYDFQVGIGANPQLIQMRFTDQDGLAIDSLGNLEIATRLNSLLKDKPIAYQSSPEMNVTVGYKLNGNLLSFELGQYDKSKPLTIDPVTRISSSYYGGLGEDVIYRMKLDSKGNQYYAGYTQSVNSIASQNGYQVSFAGSEDAFLAKFDSTGARVWATYFGGAGFDITYDVALDNNENPIIAGETNSDSLIASPNGHQVSFGGGMADGFIAKFNTTGGLEWATYLGGLAEDKINGVSCDNFGNIYAAGFTKSDDAIFFGGYQQQRAGKNDAMLIKFDPNGERTWGTYFGGAEDDYFNKVIVGGSEIYAVGSTQSNNLNINATSNYEANYDVLMTKFSSSGGVGFSRYFGGSEFDSGNSIAWDFLGTAYAIGSTKSNLNTLNAIQTTLGGFYDAAYYGALPDGTASVISYFGGESNDFGNDIFSSDNSVYLVGSTISQTGIGNNGFQNSSNGKQEGFFAKISNSNLIFSSYYGGNGNDDIRTIAADKDKYYIAGFTESSSSISTAGSYQTSYSGNADGFFASFNNTKFDLSASGNYCIGQTVPFTVSTNIIFNPNTLFKIELSNAAGAFGANPILLATKTNLSGTQTVLLSKDILGDSINGQRLIRIRSTSPEYISSTQEIVIWNKLKLDTVIKTKCVNNEIIFSANKIQGNVDFSWDFGDTIIKNKSFNVIRNFNTAGQKKLKLTRSIKNACTEVDSITFVINENPQYEIVTQENYCANSSGTFQVVRKDTLSVPSTIKNVSVQNGYNVSKIKEGIYSFEIFEVTNRNNILEFIAENESTCSSTIKLRKTIKRNDFTEIKGETNPVIGIKYIYNVIGNSDSRPVNWTTDTSICSIINQTPVSCQVEFKKNGKLTLFCTELNLQCPSSMFIDLEVMAADKATFKPQLDTICNLNSYVLTTSSDSNITIQWELYNSTDTIRGTKSFFEFTPNKLIGSCKIKLVKTNKLNMLKDSIIQDILIKEMVYPNYKLLNNFCLGDNLFELSPSNGIIIAEFWHRYKDLEYLETTIYSNTFIYEYNPRKIGDDTDSLGRYPYLINLVLKYDNGYCISQKNYFIDAPVIYEPEIRFINGNLETDVANEYLWVLNGSKTFTTQSIENPENGTYSLKVKYGDCYTYSSTYSLNRNSIENDKVENIKVIQNNETLELSVANGSSNLIVFSNLLGNVIFASNENTTNVSIPIVGLPSGVYILQVKSNQDSFIRKIILER